MQTNKKTNLLDVLKEEKKKRQETKAQKSRNLEVDTKFFNLKQSSEEIKEDHNEPKTPEFTISNSDDHNSIEESSCKMNSGRQTKYSSAKENDSKEKGRVRFNSSFPTSIHSEAGLKTTGETFQSDGAKSVKRSTNLIDLFRKPDINSSSFL